MGSEDDLIDEFTVAPIAYRQEPNGTPNALGRKYEGLLEARDAATAQLPKAEKDMAVAIALERAIDRTPIQAALNDIVGRNGSASSPGEAGLGPSDMVLHELLLAVRRLDPCGSALVYAVGCKIRFEGTM